MNPTEKIVALIRGALKGIATVRTFIDIKDASFLQVPVEINGVRIVFNMRFEINHVLSAELDGITFEHRDFIRVAWTPPREDDFADWWSLMEGYTDYTIDELFINEEECLLATRKFKRGDGSEAANKAVERYINSLIRPRSYEPFSYFNAEDQTTFENLLKATPPRIVAG